MKRTYERYACEASVESFLTDRIEHDSRWSTCPRTLSYRDLAPDTGLVGYCSIGLEIGMKVWIYVKIRVILERMRYGKRR